MTVSVSDNTWLFPASPGQWEPCIIICSSLLASFPTNFFPRIIHKQSTAITLVWTKTQRPKHAMPIPSHLSPCLTRPNSISPQKSQKCGDRYEWTCRSWGRISSSSGTVSATTHSEHQRYTQSTQLQPNAPPWVCSAVQRQQSPVRSVLSCVSCFAMSHVFFLLHHFSGKHPNGARRCSRCGSTPVTPFWALCQAIWKSKCCWARSFSTVLNQVALG